MNCLEILGLSDIVTEDVMSNVLNAVWQRGKSFPGYRIMYHYANYGHVEFIVGVSQDDKEDLIFNTHVMGNYFWKLEVSEIGEFRCETSETGEKIMFFRHPEKGTIAPVFLIMQDVIPSYLEGDSVYMQVNAFPVDIHYYKDEHAYRDSCPRMMGAPCSLAPNKIFALPTSEFSNVNGKIKSVTKLIQAAHEAPELLCVVIDTDFGELPIVHAIDRIDEKEREFIKVGCTVSAVCLIQGDVALEEYNHGAIYDETNDLRLLHSCIGNGDYQRMRNAFAENCVYFSAKTGQEKARGKEAIIADLTDIYNQQHAKIGFEQIALRATINDCPNAQLIGRSCILLQIKGEQNSYGALMIDVDGQGKIKEIKGVPGGSRIAPLLPTQPDEEEEDFPSEGTKAYYMFGDEDMWLGRFKDCVDEGELAFHTYYGIVEDADLEICDENKKYVHGREKIWETFHDIFESWKDIENLSTDIVSVADKPTLRVQLDNTTAYIKLYLSEDQKIGKICLSFTAGA